MARQITAPELAEVVTGLLVHPELMGDLDTTDSYYGFMQAIGEAVADFCGGQVNGVNEDMGDGHGPTLSVSPNDSLSSLRDNIWAHYDDPDAWDESEAEECGIELGEAPTPEQIHARRRAITQMLAEHYIDYLLNRMSNELSDWQKAQGLPQQCAEEQLGEDGLTPEQSSYLTEFCRRWNNTSKGKL
jgi:hypothetical protein